MYPPKGNSAVRVDLMECVKKTQAVAQAMADRKWDLAVELRGKSFQNNLNTYRYVRPQTRPQYFSSRWVSSGYNEGGGLVPKKTVAQYGRAKTQKF